VGLGRPEIAQAAPGPTSLLAGQNSSAATLLPFPQSPPRDPFSINVDNPLCGPENVSAAKSVLDEIKSYVSTQQFVPEKHLKSGIVLLLHKTTSSYALLLTMGQATPETVSALINCALIHGSAQPLDYEQAHVFLTSTVNALLIFMPQVGLYINTSDPGIKFMTPQTDAIIPGFRKDGALSPADPFEVVPGPQCTDKVRDVAKILLDSLRLYFSARKSGRLPVNPDQIVIHENSGRQSSNSAAPKWYEIRLLDPTFFDVLQRCSSIELISKATLSHYGIAAIGAPGLNYASPVGLYTPSGE